MSKVKVFPGATPSRRLNMAEFLKEKNRKLDDNHTTLIIKKLEVEKDMEHVNDQVTMHEGAVLFLNQIIKEWTVYENDTLRLREAEERGCIERIEQKQEEQEKLKKKRKKKRGKSRKVVSHGENNS